MTGLCLSLCLHLAFVIDRIEPPWAIAEWNHMPTFGDVALDRFPTPPKEGSRWIIHVPLGQADPPVPVFITLDSSSSQALEVPKLNAH